MPKKPMNAKMRRGPGVLTPDQRYFLLTGLWLDGSERDRFSSVPTLREAWAEHKHEILEVWRMQGNKGRRPWAWWFIEQGLGELDEDGEGMSVWQEVEGLGGQRQYLTHHRMTEEWENE